MVGAESMAVDVYICPGCGGEVAVGSKSCPTCDPPKPWEQHESLDGVDLDLPEDDSFDYQGFIEDEFGGGRRPRDKMLFWAITAIVLLVALGMRRFFF